MDKRFPSPAAPAAGSSDTPQGRLRLFVVERRLPGMTAPGLAMLHHALTLATGRFSDEKDLRYLWSLFIPGQDRLLSLFAAASSEHVREANDASLIPYHAIERAHDLDDPAPEREV